MRPLISYDDITLPYQVEASRSTPYSTRPPPSKKRKWTNQKSKQPSQQRRQDHPGQMSESTEDTNAAEVESHELTHEDIWDDTSLIAAWNAATEEYEAHNGPEKGWKTDPVHKSPLWYNTPPSSAKKGSTSTDDSVTVLPLPKNVHSRNDQEDSIPVDFDTFVPSHNPSLGLMMPPHPSPAPGPDHFLLDPPGPVVDEDEAFMRATGAMYWAGYWTAVYRCQKSTVHKRRRDDKIEDEDGNDSDDVAEQDGDEEEEEEKDREEVGETHFVSTQR